MSNIIAQFWNVEWRLVVSVASPFVAALIILLFNPLYRKYKMHNPLQVTYLVPKEKYGEISFVDADDEEKTPNRLTVGIGYYRVIHLIVPKREIDIGPVKLRFSGPNKNKPKPRGVDNPYWVDEIMGRASQPAADQYMNWEGEVYPTQTEWPLHLVKKEPLYIGNGVETTGPWDGEIILAFPVYKWKIIEKCLKFHVTVTENKDDIPFLKGERNSKGKHKEIQEREDSKQKSNFA